MFQWEFKDSFIKNSPLYNPTIEAPKLPLQKQQLIPPQHVKHCVVDLTPDWLICNFYLFDTYHPTYFDQVSMKNSITDFFGITTEAD